MTKVLVTGGAGYIGANICKELLKHGYQVRVLDNFSNGLKSRLEGMNVEVIQGDILDRSVLTSTMKEIDAVIHLAAKKSVEESVKSPIKYYENNFSGTLNIIAAMAANNVKRIVFSSTAVVYKSGGPNSLSESDPKEPLSPYAHSKLLSEDVLTLALSSDQISSVSLRYFNVVGAGGSGLGDNARDNLVPKTFAALKSGKIPEIYGDDYTTRDGTCIRDYIHVVDLAEAHLMALEVLNDRKVAMSLNVGSGTGYTVKEVMEQIKKSSRIDFTPNIRPRRAGDPETLIANIESIKKELGWHPRLGLAEMIESSWLAESSAV
jgi:UDP-glucose 4-epimerase